MGMNLCLLVYVCAEMSACGCMLTSVYSKEESGADNTKGIRGSRDYVMHMYM